jgi:hypothetical protein
MAIKTTGELREFLANMLLGIKNGDLDEHKARNITKMAAQINESFYSEIKIAKVRMEAGDEAAKLGELAINK